MPRRREIPLAPISDPTEVEVRGSESLEGYRNSPLEREAAMRLAAPPELATEAIMQAPPHMEPLTSREEMLPLRNVLADALEQLEPHERWVFERAVIERQSIRSIAADLSVGKSTADRYKQQAIQRLQQLLEGDERIIDYLKQ